MLTIDPLRWSPFFNVTCSACSDKLLQISITNANDQTRFTTGHLFPRNEKRNLTCALKFCCWLRSLRVSRTSSYANQFGSALSGGRATSIRQLSNTSWQTASAHSGPTRRILAAPHGWRLDDRGVLHRPEHSDSYSYDTDLWPIP